MWTQSRKADFRQKCLWTHSSSPMHSPIRRLGGSDRITAYGEVSEGNRGCFAALSMTAGGWAVRRGSLFLFPAFRSLFPAYCSLSLLLAEAVDEAGGEAEAVLHCGAEAGAEVFSGRGEDRSRD